MIPVVMSGGMGTRLWPLSRACLPKQFCQIFSENLFELTLRRLQEFGSPWALTTRELRVLTERSFQRIGVPLSQGVYEPSSRNTAPALALMCQILRQRGLGAQAVGIFPADHLIENEDTFRAALHLAEIKAAEHDVVTLGVKPTYPATGFGYIEIDSHVEDGLRACRVRSFREKPDATTATEFVAAKRFFWNAGIFVFQPDRLWKLFELHAPNIATAIGGLKADQSNLTAIYEQLPNISFDYAIMEKAENQVCIPCDLGWNDLGSWDDVATYAEAHPLEANEALTLSVRSNGCFAFSNRPKTVAFLGLEDVVAIETADALLLAKRGMTQEVREVIGGLRERQRPEEKNHVFEDRPWGRFEILRDAKEFKSKVITVEAGAQISYQSHSQRSEHWVIVSGSGEVVLDDQVLPVGPGTYTYIPQGAKHRIRNTGVNPLVFVEVQIGSYFGEDDIVRYQDDYKRV